MAAAMEVQGFDLTAPGTPEHLSGYRISSGFFSTLVRKSGARKPPLEENSGNPY
jgi:hypothetical protein